MSTQQLSDLAKRAEEIYERRLKAQLERDHRDEFVAIEPISETHFLGHTLTEAIWAASKEYPDRQAYALRIGRPVAVEIGNSPR